MTHLQEFWYCVAAQGEIPLPQGGSPGDGTVGQLLEFLDYFRGQGQAPLAQALPQALLEHPAFVSSARVLLGISDKRFYLDMTYLAHMAADQSGRRLVPERREDLRKHNTAWFLRQLTLPGKENWAELISGYFLSSGLEQILTAFLSLSEPVVRSIFRKLIAPKEDQQKHAKIRGHGAEQLAARCLREWGVSFQPQDKDLRPMGQQDPNVDLRTMTPTHHQPGIPHIASFDLLILDGQGRIRGLVQSLIHTSDPGQFGVDKSDKTLEIRRYTDRYNQAHPEAPVSLIGIVDGVGYCENVSGTIAKMLTAFDCFVQVHTLFKLHLQQLGLLRGIRAVRLEEAFFTPEAMAHFEAHYLLPAGAALVRQPLDSPGRPAGKAALWGIEN